MKGFPNQVADLEKIAKGIATLGSLVAAAKDAKDDGVFGEALVRSGVAGTGHTPKPVEDYIREQLKKSASNQSFRTTARGLRELYRLMRLIDDSGQQIVFTDLGRQAVAFAGADITPPHLEFWRGVIRDIAHEGENGEVSHPYQVLLRLVARKPNITRAKCALALEARNDSPQELDRIVALSDLSEEEICDRIGETKPNWDNAKKILPRFAEQLGDVIRRGQSYTLADAPGRAANTDKEAGPAKRPTPNAGVASIIQSADLAQTNTLARALAGKTVAPNAPEPTNAARQPAAPRAPRASRSVTPETIGRAGTAERFDDVRIPTDVDPAAAQAAIEQRLDRLKRHNLIVQQLAARLFETGGQLFEDPFDVLALIGELGILVEVKTLDGSASDERDRVKEALAQLLYYEAFVTAPVVGATQIHKIACFEKNISEAHQEWLNKAGIATIWQIGPGRFAGNRLASDVLGGFLKELR